MKNKIYHTVRTVINEKQNIPHRSNCHKTKKKYTTPLELSSNEKQNIPHRSNCHKMKNEIYHIVRTVIK